MRYPKESLAVQHENQIPNLTTLLNYLNVVFTTLFTIEMVFKMVAFKPKVSYWTFLDVHGYPHPSEIPDGRTGNFEIIE